MLLEFIESDHWEEHRGRLIVLERGGDVSALTLELFRDVMVPMLAANAEKIGPSRRPAAWVAQPDLAGPILKVWEFMANAGNPDSFRVFHTEREAEAWLSKGDQ